MEFLRILLEEQKKGKGIVICGFPGVGKSTIVDGIGSDNILDSDSSNFSKDDFPSNYIKYIKSVIEGGKIILASSHDVVRDALIKEGISFILVYPDVGLKKEYLNRYTKRGSPASFNELLDKNFEKWVGECDDIDNELVKKIKLKRGQYLIDVIDDICLIYFNSCIEGIKGNIPQRTMQGIFKIISPLLGEYDKTAIVKGKKLKGGEKIITNIDGEKETENVAKEGDILIKGVGGEEYIISLDTFKERYVSMDNKPIKNVSMEFEEYKSIGKCYAFRYDGEDIKFIASWKEEMICNGGDYLATTDRDKIEVYRIEKSVFDKSYSYLI